MLLYAIAATLITIFSYVDYVTIAQAQANSIINAKTHSNECNAALWKFAYNPSKLEAMDSCISVSGVIASFSTELDGDCYVQITHNPQFNFILTHAGFTFQAGTGILNQASR